MPMVYAVVPGVMMVPVMAVVAVAVAVFGVVLFGLRWRHLVGLH
jgi:hypothetical protein